MQVLFAPVPCSRRLSYPRLGLYFLPRRTSLSFQCLNLIGPSNCMAYRNSGELLFQKCNSRFVESWSMVENGAVAPVRKSNSLEKNMPWLGNMNSIRVQ